MSNLLKSINLKAELDSLRPLKPEDEQRIMQKFRLDWNYHSNNLEGNSLTYGETKALILFGITANGKPLKDHFEITGHDEAIKWVLDIVKNEREISEKFIRELHLLLLKESYEIDAKTHDGLPIKKRVQVGEYKTSNNHVETITGEMFYFANWEDVPFKMNELIEWYREKSANVETNPIILAAEFHYRFIRIHPFDDGNGRTARILMNFILMSFGYPPVIIKTEDKQNYFAALRQADVNIFEPFAEYIALNLNHSLEIMIAGAKGESIDEPDDIDKEIKLLEKKLNESGDIVENIKNNETVKEVFVESIIPLLTKFLYKGKLFENFYARKLTQLSIGDIFTKQDNLEQMVLLENQVDSNIESIEMGYYYYGLQNAQKFKFNFVSSFKIIFEYSKYFIENNKNERLLEKKYNQNLNKDEILNLVNNEVKRHKEVIEQQIEENK